MKDSEILKRVRQKIEYGSPFICWAIDMVRAPRQQKERLIAWVMSMLKGCHTYGQWVEVHHKRTYIQMSVKRDSFKEGRLAWLDWMITECEKEEAK